MFDKIFWILFTIFLIFVCGCGQKKSNLINTMSGASLEVSNNESVLFLKYPSLYALVINKDSVDSGSYNFFMTDLSKSTENIHFKKVLSGMFGVNAETIKYEDLKFIIQGGSATSSHIILGGIVVFEDEMNSYQMAIYPSSNLSELDVTELSFTSNKHISSDYLEQWISSQMPHCNRSR